MALSAGARLGPYEIVAPAGAGGMGEVYRARDTRLDRTVAIKVLPAEFANDAQLRLRFDREAKTISQLNHPNICSLFDVGDDYLVMEYLEGETLGDRIARGRIALEEAVQIAKQIAAALATAHRNGIIHRDLKPGNIILTKTGAKLVDFGLAKTSAVLSPQSSVLETAAKSLTQEGTIVGTFQYMAPEQLEGAEADARTDIFAFGCVLYEMVTGRRAFQGKSKVSLIAAILEHDPPPITSTQPLSPPELDRLIRTCLEKNPDDRWQSAHDVLLQLRSLDFTPRTAARSSGKLWIAPAIAALLIAAAFAAWWHRNRAAASEPITTSIIAPEKVEFDFESGAMALAPDGKRIAFIGLDAMGKRTIWVRSLRSLAAQSLAGTDDATYPFWSPDSRFIAFFANGNLKKIDANGGPPETLCEARVGRGGTWGADDTIVFTPDVNGGLYKVHAGGGSPVAVTTVTPSEATHRFPFFLPDGKRLIFFVGRGSGYSGAAANSSIAALNLATGARTEIIHAASPAQYSSGFLLFRREQSLVAQPLDPATLRVTGDAFPVAEGLRVSSTNQGIFTVDMHGDLAYSAGASLALSQLQWFDRTGKLLGNITAPGDYRFPALSHDGRKIAVALIDANIGNQDIWIIDLARSTSTRLTFDPSNEFLPLWSPDDRYVYFTSNRNDPGDVFRKLASGVGGDEEILRMPGLNVLTDISSDGKLLALQSLDPNGKRGWNTWVYSLADKRLIPFVQTDFNEMNPKFSPDGKWVAYQSDESGKNQVYVQPYPATGGKWQVSTDGGERMRWSAKGDELFFTNLSAILMVAKVRTGATFEAEIPQPLFAIKTKVGPDQRYALSPDAQRIVVNSSLREDVRVPVTFVQNWPALHQQH